jgi:hypothetical protein
LVCQVVYRLPNELQGLSRPTDSNSSFQSVVRRGN